MLVNLSIQKFKESFACNSIDIVRNPNTQKLFASCDNGKNIKVEQAIDFAKSMEVLMEEGDLDTACIINTRSSNVQITL